MGVLAARAAGGVADSVPRVVDAGDTIVTLRDWIEEKLLPLEIQAIRADLTALTLAVVRIADALELQNAHTFPLTREATPDSPAFTLTHVDDAEQAELMDIELRLTAARGQLPTEDEILTEFELHHPPAL